MDRKALIRVLADVTLGVTEDQMRDRLLLVVAIGAVATAGFVGCGDGESGGGTGGSGGTGGVAGDAGHDGDAATTCHTASFTIPVDGATLSAANDADSDCSNGIQLDVTLATNAPDGTAATLLADAQEVGKATAAASVLTFKNVTLKSTGKATLTLRFDSDSTCETTINVTDNCAGAACDISKPVLTPTHPKLNGVPVAQGGDRASAAGQDYQAAFEVTTDIEDGQPVSLAVDGNVGVVVALAQGGLAKFAGVTLVPDGDHKVQASCQAKNGQAGASNAVTYPVDTTPPDLTNLTPADGQFFGPSDDSNTTKAGLQFKVCGQTSAGDALDLPTSLGGSENNFCAGVGTSTPQCVAAKKGAVAGADGGCVELDCPGGAPFDLTVTLKDDAGNPTTKTITGVRCASSLPSVQIIEPVDGVGSDVTKHILAASMSQARKDQDATTLGAQYTVVACTDVAGTGTLSAGLVGSAAPVAGQIDIPAVAAQASDNCPTGLGYVIKFANATLTESAENPTNNTLTTATELKVDVKDVSSALGSSPAVQVWVDSHAPTVTEWVPLPLCGKLYQSATDVSQNLEFGSTNSPTTVTITSNGVPQNYPETTYSAGFSYFGNVTFKLGTNDVTATTTEPSGNIGSLKTPCTVTVGNPPVVTWTAPTQATALNASTDGNAGAAGWQGTLTVQTDVGGSGGTVTFKVTCGGTTTTIGSANIDGAGVATLPNATLPECASATITAETSDIAGKGVGTASLSGKPIDTVIPGAPTGLAVAVKDRRATSFTLSWTAPSDSGATVGGYQVRVSKQPITAANFDVAEVVSYSGSPKAPGQAESLDVNSRLIETDYYFAVAATDAAGNRSGIVAAGPTKAKFNQTILTAGTLEELGVSLDASTSVNGDAYSDLIVGGRNSSHAYLWLGSQTGFASTPDVTFTGVAGTRFGQGLAVVGDIDGDGLPDIAMGAPLDSGKGRVFIFKGRASWPSALSNTQADYVIDVDSTTDSAFSGSLFGNGIFRLGDFDQDGAPDFAVGAFLYGGGRGYVAVVRGVVAGQTFPSSVSIPQAVGSRVIAYPGDSALPNGWFGLNVVGMGPYYSGNHPAMVVSAPFAGQLYGFQGDSGVTGTIATTSAKETYSGSATLWTGFTLSNLGPLGASSGLGVGSPGTFSTTGGDARLFAGNATGIFAGSVATITDSACVNAGDNFGRAVFGGGFSGATNGVSFLGSSGVDIGVSMVRQAGGAAKLYLTEGYKLSVSGDIVSLADVVISLPTDWYGSSYLSGPAKDINNDGYADIAIGEQANVSASYNGRVIVFW